MSRAKNWCFTLNNYTNEDIERLEGLGDQVSYLIYGKEVGDTGTPHLQGFVAFPNRLRMAQAIAIIGQAHFTVARNVPASIEYCKKEGDFSEIGEMGGGQGSRSDLDAFKEDVKGGNLSMKSIRELHSEVAAKYGPFVRAYVGDNMPKRAMTMHPLRPWQAELNATLNGPPDDRTIVFIVDVTGNSGKTWFAHYYCHLHPDTTQVMQPGKFADMAFALEETARVIFVDASRSKQGEYIQYNFLEEMKNGYVFSSKYESRTKQLQACHVVVSMNEMPDMSKLSEDRYKIIEL